MGEAEGANLAKVEKRKFIEIYRKMIANWWKKWESGSGLILKSRQWIYCTLFTPFSFHWETTVQNLLYVGHFHYTEKRSCTFVQFNKLKNNTKKPKRFLMLTSTNNLHNSVCYSNKLCNSESSCNSFDKQQALSWSYFLVWT